MTTINLNQPPYFDDFSEDNKFYQILFRPGRAVQARELNQIQTLLKTQLSRLGQYTFKNGSVVTTRNDVTESIKYVNNGHFIKLDSTNDNKTENEDQLKTYWLNKTIVKSESNANTQIPGPEAKVIGYELKDANNQVRLYLDYTKADTVNGTTRTYSPGDSVLVVDGLATRAAIINDQYGVGYISYIKLAEAVYFYNGRFVLVDAQTKFLTPTESDYNNNSKWNSTPSASVGLKFTESLVSWSENEDLLDNASGSPNVGAPGADRLSVDAKLIQLPLNADTVDYVQLASIRNGILDVIVKKDQWAQIGDRIASRTYDESGDYTVDPFLIEIKNYLKKSPTDSTGAVSLENDLTFRGPQANERAIEFAKNEFGLTDPNLNESDLIHTHVDDFGVGIRPGKNLSDLLSLTDQYNAVVIEPGKAYVRGYEVQTVEPKIRKIKKARTTKFENNISIRTSLGNFLLVNKLYGSLSTNTYDIIDLYSKPITTPGTTSGNKIGTAKVLSIEYASGSYDPNISVSDDRVYKLYLFDIQMLNDDPISSIKSIYSNNPSFTCDVIPDKYTLTGTVSRLKSFSYTGNIVNGTPSNPNTINLTSASASNNLTEGMIVNGQNIQSETFITNVNKTTNTITLSKNATSTLTGGTFSFTNIPNFGTPINIVSSGNTTINTTTISNIPNSVYERLFTGMTVSSSGSQIPSGTKISALLGTTTVGSTTTGSVSIDQRSTATGASVTLTFFSQAQIPLENINKVLIGNGTRWRNDSTQQLKKGDYILVGPANDTTTEKSKIYTVASNPESDTVIFVNENTLNDSWLDNSPIVYLSTSLKDDSTLSGGRGLLYSLPNFPVATVRGINSDGTINSSSIDCRYKIRKTESNKTVNQGTYILLNLGNNQGEFDDSITEYSYSVIMTSGNPSTNPNIGKWFKVFSYSDGMTVQPGTAGIKIGNSSNELQIYLNSVDRGSQALFQVEYTVIKNGSGGPGDNSNKEKLKTLIKGSFINGTYVGGTLSKPAYVVAENQSDLKRISLNYPDVLKITRVVMSPSYAIAPSDSEILPPGHNDITGAYLLDGGQRDYYYTTSYAVLLANSRIPTGQVRIEFDYFEHGSNGDYFSVNSYPFIGGTQELAAQNMDYSEIPNYIATDGTKYDLASTLDFRPIFNPNGQSASISMAIPKDNFVCDYHYYVGRKDALALNSDGEFFIVYGQPDDNPVLPPDPDKAMVLYELSVLPYTHTPLSIDFSVRNNKRYTMNDIRRLENRISNLEYYTALSLLEQDTNDLEVKDALGRNRFKNGFLVDNFKTNNGNNLDPEFKCTVYNDLGIAKPLMEINTIELMEKIQVNPETTGDTFDSRRNNFGYQKTGDYITLPYTTVVAIEQKKASTWNNINPFNMRVYAGQVDIYPWSDTWFETKQTTRAITDTSAYDAAFKSFRGQKAREVNGKTHYTIVTNLGPHLRWIGQEKVTKEKTGRQLLVGAGPRSFKKIRANDRRGIGWEAIKRQQLKRGTTVKVPTGLGYVNEGQEVQINTGQFVDKNGVPIGENREVVREEWLKTRTRKAQTVTTFSAETFIDEGYDTKTIISNAVVDTKEQTIIRSNEINFTGRGFSGSTRLYAFFDGAGSATNVSEYCKPEGGNYNDPLKTDAYGNIKGTFKIPDPNIENNPKFKTGDRIFTLTSSPTNAQAPDPTAGGGVGFATYTANGFIQTQESVTLTTRKFRIVNTFNYTKGAIQEITLGTEKVWGNLCAKDPVAQSFYVRENGGCYITHIDVFFQSKPSETNADGTINRDQPPVTLHLVEMGDQGFPTRRIVPFGEVTKQAAEVITNVVDTVNNTLTVVGYKNTLTNTNTTPSELFNSNINVTPEITGPWKFGEPILNPSPSDVNVVYNYGLPFLPDGTTPAKRFNYSLADRPSTEQPLAAGQTKDPTPHMVPTRFKFESPIYLADKQSYGFILSTPANESVAYNVWIADSSTSGSPSRHGAALRDAVIGVTSNVEIGKGDAPITNNPYLDGEFFESKQGLTWVPYPYVSMKFRIHKCKFVISPTGANSILGEVNFVNSQLDRAKLTTDPFSFSNFSSDVRVDHPSHGHTTARENALNGKASKVVFSPTYNLTLTRDSNSQGSGLILGSDRRTITTLFDYSSILSPGHFIKNPNSNENRSIFSITSNTIVLNYPFSSDNSNIIETDVVQATNYAVPSGINFANIPSDCIYDYLGFDVKNTELDSYTIDISPSLTRITRVTKRGISFKVNGSTPAKISITSADLIGVFEGMRVFGPGIPSNKIIYVQGIDNITKIISLSEDIDFAQSVASDFYFEYLPLVSVNTPYSKFGGPGVLATENIPYSSFRLITSKLEPNQSTSIEWSVVTTTGAGVNDSTSLTFVQDPLNFVNFSPDNEVEFLNPMLVASYINELGASTTGPSGPSTITSTDLSDKKTFKIKAILRSSNENLSPVLDMTPVPTAALYSTRLNTPRGKFDVGVEVDPQTIINSQFDNYQVIPTTLNPEVSSSNLIRTITKATNGITVTNSSSTVTGVGTKFKEQLKPGQTISIVTSNPLDSVNEYVIDTITDNEEMTLTTNYTGSTSSSVSIQTGKLYFTSSGVGITGTVTSGTFGEGNPLRDGTTNTRLITWSGAGNKTKFLSDLSVGDIIETVMGERRKIVAINSDTELLVDRDILQSFKNSILFTNPKNLIVKTSDSNIAKHLSNLDVGKYVSFTGRNIFGQTRDFTDVMVLGVEYTPNNELPDIDLQVGDSNNNLVFENKPCLIKIELDYINQFTEGFCCNSGLTIVQKDRYIDEVAPTGGSVESKYISSILLVPRPSNALKISFDATRDESCDIELYYRILEADSSRSISNTNWIKTEFNTELNGQLVEIYPSPSIDEYIEYESTIDNLPQFTEAQIKIVMRGGNPARAVSITNVRIIALDE